MGQPGELARWKARKPERLESGKLKRKARESIFCKKFYFLWIFLC